MLIEEAEDARLEYVQGELVALCGVEHVQVDRATAVRPGESAVLVGGLVPDGKLGKAGAEFGGQ